MQTVLLFFGRLREQVTVNHRVQQPIPVLLGHVGDEPGIALAVEANLLRKPTLNKEVGCAQDQKDQVPRVMYGNLDTYHRHSRNTTRIQRYRGRCPLGGPSCLRF